jgi:hypothetical protein
MNPKIMHNGVLGDYSPHGLPTNAQIVNIVKLYLRGREMFYAQN